MPSSAANPPAAPGTAPPPGMFDLITEPGTSVLHSVDPSTLTESQRKFGVAPRHGSGVEYQPGVIIMEQGDKAIQQVASNGLSWQFDAKAPQVDGFQEGKIVFATGRAVGRIVDLKRSGDSVTVVLGPVQLTDVIKNGTFAISEPIDAKNMIPYVAQDFPQPKEQNEEPASSDETVPDDQIERAVVVSWISPDGTWTPTSVAQTYGDGRRVTYRRVGNRWSEPTVSLPRLSSARLRHSFDAQSAMPVLTALQVTPGIPQLPQVPQNPLAFPNADQLGNMPVVDIDDVKTVPRADFSAIGLQFSYYKKGLGVSAYTAMSVRSLRIDFQLLIKDGTIITCGINLGGALGVKMNLDGNTYGKDFSVNWHKTWWEPVDLSIPLGLNSASPVPFSVTFNMMLQVGTGFSAKNAVLKADGDYTIGGGLWAGYKKDGGWRVSPAGGVTPVKDLGVTATGVSVGINSIELATSVRAMVGIGAFGFNTGVYGGLRFGGTVLRAPDTAWACRQGTIEAHFDSGVGYSLPPVITDIINAVLALFTHYQLDRVGSILKGPVVDLFTGTTQIPAGCATPKKTAFNALGRFVGPI